MQLQHQFHFQTLALLSLGLGLILCEHPAIFLDSSESQIGFVIGMDTLDSVHWTLDKSCFHLQLHRDEVGVEREPSEVAFELVLQPLFDCQVVFFGIGGYCLTDISHQQTV